MKRVLFVFIIFFLALIPVYGYTESKVGIGIYHSNMTYRPYIYEIIEGSPADKAGLEKGDLIIEVNGKKVFNARESLINGKEGDEVKIKILRGLDERIYTFKLGSFVYSANYLSEEKVKETDFSFVESSSYEHTYSIEDFHKDYEYYLLLRINTSHLLFSDFFIEDGKINKEVKIKRIHDKDFKITASDLSKSYLLEQNTFRGFVAIKIDDEYYFDSVSRVGGHFNFTGDKKMTIIKEMIKSKYYKENDFKRKARALLQSYKRKVGGEKYYTKINKIKLILERKRYEIVDNIKTEEDLIRNSGTLQRVIDIEDIILEDANEILDDVIQDLIKPLE